VRRRPRAAPLGGGGVVGGGAGGARGRALRGIVDGAAIRRAFAADAGWGIAAVLWLATGLTRLFVGTEKSMEFYLRNPLFHLKMGLFLLVLVLEIWPMITLIRWRRAMGRNQTATFGSAHRIARISNIEAFIIVIIVFVAAALARGYTLGMPSARRGGRLARDGTHARDCLACLPRTLPSCRSRWRPARYRSMT
jgi:putative membrane protein